MKEIKFVYFDLGGVFFDYQGATEKLAHSLNVSHQVLNKLLVENNPDLYIGKLTPNEFWEQYKDKLDFKNDLTIDFGQVWVECTKPIVPMCNFYMNVKSKYSTGFITNLWPSNFEKLTKKNNIPVSKNSVIIDSSVVGFAKPDKNIFNKALVAARCKPSQILFIDDLDINIASATKLGWNGITFETDKPKKSIELISSYLNL